MTGKLRGNCLNFSLLVLSLLFLQSVQAQPKRGKIKEIGTERFAEFDTKFVQNQKQAKVDGTALIWTDTLIYKRETGDADAKAQIPIGDLSKWLTTALVLQFVDEGKLTLDDKVTSYLPIFAKYGKSFITIRHCLTNYTGIQSNPVSLTDITRAKKFASLEEKVNDYPKQEIKANAGTEFRYSNDGFDIAARIVEIVSKKKFDMIIKQKLLNPLGMRQTTFSTLDATAPSPSNGAMSSANDYIHFLQMLLNNGTYNGIKLLSDASVNELRTLQTKQQDVKYVPKSAEGYSYALGSWAVETTGNKANVLTTSNLFGSWAIVDWCRGYAAVMLVKELEPEQKKDALLQLKDAIDDRIPNKCR